MSGSLDPPLDPRADHVRGDPAAAVALVEYGDYECPYSRSAFAAVEAVRPRLGGRLAYAFRHLPLRDRHPQAQLAAEAAEAAAAQGRFWEMHDRLFALPAEELGPDAVRSVARELELDMGRFEEDLTRHVHAERVQRDLDSALRSGASGTPTFFVAGERYTGFYDPETLLETLEDAALAAGG